MRHISEARPSVSDKLRVVLLWALRHEGDNERLSGLVQRMALLDASAGMVVQALL